MLSPKPSLFKFRTYSCAPSEVTQVHSLVSQSVAVASLEPAARYLVDDASQQALAEAARAKHLTSLADPSRSQWWKR